MHDVIIDDTRTSLAATSEKTVREKKPQKKRSFSVYLLDWVEKALIVACLVSIDFLLFAGAGSYRMFGAMTFLNPEVWYILGGIFALSVLVMYILSFSSFFQNFVVSAVLSLFIIVMLNQFAAFDKNSMFSSLAATYVSQDFGLLLNYVSHIVLSIIIGFLFFLFVSFASKKTIAWFVLFLMLMMIAIIFGQYSGEKKNLKYNVVKEDVLKVNGKPGKRFIFIGLPTVGSYNYLNDVANSLQKSQSEYESLRKTLDIMLGFYSKNNFILYPHAYVNDVDANTNWGQTFNANNSKSASEYTQKNISVNKFWKFDYLTPKYLFLRENKLYDTFKKAKFGINAYQTGGVEMCKENNEMIVNRCVEKNGLPIDFDGMNVGTDKKVGILLAQWLESTGLFEDFSYSYNILRPFVDVETFPMVGISYRNIDVKNSLDMLDMLIKDVETDTGNKAYFVNLNVPGNTYIYDEFCRIKPIEKWQNKYDLPWVKKIGEKEKRKAYSEQLRCVFGALENFMTQLENSEAGKKSVIVIQGLSGINGMTPVGERNFINELKNKKYTDMAIKDPLKNEFKVEYDICSTPNILKQYLYRKSKCPELKEFNLHVDAAKDLADSLHNLKIDKDLISSAQSSFDRWYEQWQQAQSNGVKKAKNLLAADKEKAGQPEIKADLADTAQENVDVPQVDKISGMESDGVEIPTVKPEQTETKEQVSDVIPETEVKEVKMMDNPVQEKPETAVEKLSAQIQLEGGEKAPIARVIEKTPEQAAAEKAIDAGVDLPSKQPDNIPIEKNSSKDE